MSVTERSVACSVLESMSEIIYRTNEIAVCCDVIESGETTLMKYLSKGIPRRILWDYNHEHDDMGYTVHYVNQIKESFIDEGRRHLVFQPFRKRDSDFEEFMDTVVKFRNFTLIIEEAERYARGGRKPKMPESLKDLIDTGAHHRGTGLIATCRRVGSLNEDIIFNAHHVFVFRQFRPQDTKYLKEWLGIKREVIQNLPAYHCLHVHKGKITVRKPVPI